MNEEHLL